MAKRRRPVNEQFLENLDSKLGRIEELNAPDLAWRVIDAVVDVVEDELTWADDLIRRDAAPLTDGV